MLWWNMPLFLIFALIHATLRLLILVLFHALITILLLGMGKVKNCNFFKHKHYRCNDDCEVEKGWECTDRSPAGVDLCYEVCGDSWDMRTYECDDGNVDYPSSIYGADG